MACFVLSAKWDASLIILKTDFHRVSGRQEGVFLLQDQGRPAL
jgi:hypothetical protein